MQYYAAPLEKLIEQFQRLPGVGRKSAQRLAFYLLSLPQGGAEEFAQTILDARGSIHTCRICQNLTEGEVCPICADPRRDASTICVVADPKDVGAVGAAMLVAVGSGQIADLTQAAGLIRPAARYTPDPANQALYDRNYKVFKNLYAANKKNFAALN